MILKEKSFWVNVSWMFQNINNFYLLFGNYAKMGINNLCFHPFTLLFVEVLIRINDYYSIVI